MGLGSCWIEVDSTFEMLSANRPIPFVHDADQSHRDVGLGKATISLYRLPGRSFRFRHCLLRRKSTEINIGLCQSRVSLRITRIPVDGLLEIFTGFQSRLRS